VNVIETWGLGKQFRAAWALADCRLTIPQGHVTALVGPNGAGKTTLLHCAVGLLAPSTGRITLLGGLAPGSLEARARVAFVAQDAPLHRHLSVDTMVSLTSDVNPGFDSSAARRRLARLEIPLRARVGKLSAGQQAQLALGLALARHPDLLVLDEPTGRLDPLARYDLMAEVVTAVAEEGVSVILSSHLVSELERVADHLVLLVRGHVVLTGAIEELVEEHAWLSGRAEGVEDLRRLMPVVEAVVAGSRALVLVQDASRQTLPDGWERQHVGLEEMVLSYLRAGGGRTRPGSERPEALALLHGSGGR
jgi:ABC-2 type transport system ATP-binding protein